MSKSAISRVVRSNSGTLNSFINGSVDSSIAFTTSTNIGTTGSLEITAEQDANVSSPSTYPLNFYKQYKAKTFNFLKPT